VLVDIIVRGCRLDDLASSSGIRRHIAVSHEKDNFVYFRNILYDLKVLLLCLSEKNKIASVFFKLIFTASLIDVQGYSAKGIIMTSMW